MPIDTAVRSAAASVGGAGQRAANDDELLASFEHRFSALHAAALDIQRGTTSPTPSAARGAPATGLLDQRLADQRALTLYREQRLVDAAGPDRSGRPPRPSLSARSLPRNGLGPRLVVGFDAEWIHDRKGKNRIISIQFYILAPNGSTHAKLIELTGACGMGYRPRLADALSELLDEAEAECIFDEWPHEILLAGFFTRADLTAFADFKEFRQQLDGVNGTFATVGQPASFQIPINPDQERRLRARYQFRVGDDFDPKCLRVRIIDVSRLAPPGTSLDKIGNWLEEPKIELPAGYSKSDMLTFSRKEPERFREYAIHDARLAALFAVWVMWFSDRHLGLHGISATVSGLAVRLCEACMRRDGVHPDVALNFEVRQRRQWSERHDRPVTVQERVPAPIRKWLEPFVVDAYLGGRNECFQFGPSDVGHIIDPDLTGAYVAGLAYAMTLDYGGARTTTNIADFQGHVAGFAQVRFRFPSTIRFPCMPVRVGDYGTWFPLSGVSIATAPEIELAKQMGAELDIQFGIVIPWKRRAVVFAESASRLKASTRKPAARSAKASEPELLERAQDDTFDAVEGVVFPPPHHDDPGYRPMESFAIEIRRKRSRYRRKTLPFEFVKLVGNGLYGKTGQGYKGKRQFAPRELASRPVGPSRVSEAAVAALVCGFVRATIGEILWKLPAEAKAISVTTDGFLTTAEQDQIDLTGEMCQRFKALVDRVAPGTQMLEIKHRALQVFTPRTRGGFTVLADGDEPIVIAKAGHKVVLDGDEERRRWLRSPAGESDFMIRLALNRHPGQRLPRETFFSAREQLLNGWDLQMHQNEVRVALEYDFKRMPVNPRMVRVEGYDAEHLAFETVPWPTVEAGEQQRVIFDKWRQENCLKTMRDWDNWQAALHQGLRNRRLKSGTQASERPGAAPSSRRLLGRPSTGGVTTRGTSGRVYARGGDDKYLRIVIRTFLSAYVKRAWGLEGADLSQSALAAWLTEQGYPVKPHDVKNAGRSALNDHVAVHAPDVQRFLTLVRGRFPSLEVERFLVAEV